MGTPISKNLSSRYFVRATHESPLLVFILLFAFVFNSFGFVPLAQSADFYLPSPGVMVRLSPPLDPPMLKGIKVDPNNPFHFDFILDNGSQPGDMASAVSPSRLPSDVAMNVKATQRKNADALKQEATRLIKYFLASLTIPEKDLWVNLSPYEKDRIVPNSFGLTEMGRDLLAEDYMLKQITASLIYPEDAVGKKFWKRIYEEAAKKYGTTDIPVNTFNKVWIVPEKAVVYENAKAGTAYVVESKLKVMLEEDYLSLEKHEGISNKHLPTRGHVLQKQRNVSPSTLPNDVGLNTKAPQGNDGSTSDNVNALGSQIVSEIVLPELTIEINENKNFTKLRQVYNSLILATWYKKKIKDSILAQVYADKNKIAGVRYNKSITNGGQPGDMASAVSPSRLPSNEPLNLKASQGNPVNDVERIYHRYLQAFKKGVYNYIKEDIDSATQEMIPRKYFSGGMNFTSEGFSEKFMPVIVYTHDDAMISNFRNLTSMFILAVSLHTASAQTLPVKASPADLAMISLFGRDKASKDKALREKRMGAFSEFLSLDNQLKDLMHQSLATDRGEDSTNMSNFRDEISRRLLQMQNILSLMAEDLAVQNGVSSKVRNKIKERAQFLAAQYPQSYNYKIVKQWYGQIINSMATTFLDDVNSQIVGWLPLDENLIKIADTTTSFTELLNLMHKYALVNFKITDGLSIWRKTERVNHVGGIIAVGKKTPVAENIYNELQQIFSVLMDTASPDHDRYKKRWPGDVPAVVYIFSLPGVTYLMIRDYGHALFIEIKGNEKDRLVVTYKIPKAFSKDAVSHLTDVAYSEKTGTASGQLNLVDPTKIGPVLADFIRKVPTDTSKWNLVNDQAMTVGTKDLLAETHSRLAMRFIDDAQFNVLWNDGRMSYSDVNGHRFDVSLVKPKELFEEPVYKISITGFAPQQVKGEIAFRISRGVMKLEKLEGDGDVDSDHLPIKSVLLAAGLRIAGLKNAPGDADVTELSFGSNNPGIDSKFIKRQFTTLIQKKGKEGVERFRLVFDHAMQAGEMNPVAKKYGGIDLTPSNMKLQTKNAGAEIKFHLDPALLQQLQNAPGFTPVIINMQPLTDLRAFLGLTSTA